MTIEDQKDKHLSKEGVVTISLVFLVPVIYLLSPPFVAKIMLMSGVSEPELERHIETVYAPIIYMHEHEWPIAKPLEIYYDWSFDLIVGRF